MKLSTNVIRYSLMYLFYKKQIRLSVILIFLICSNTYSQNKLYRNSFSLHDVKLLEGPFKHALDLNVDVLLQYDVDRLLAPFLREAGLPLKAETYGNWEKDGLDGHIGGHYLTSMAIHYAATDNETCKERMDYMVSELKRCQANSKHGEGYIGGVPVVQTIDGKSYNLWKELKNGNTGIIWSYWVPWYNLHKTYAGLRDAWMYGDNEEALLVFLAYCDWGIDLISHLDDNQMEEMLANEFGGMNEVYADAYQITGEEKYLKAAKRFSHKEIFDSMKNREDNLDNKHANTQVPKAVGYQRVAEVSGDPDYTAAATFFWETVVYNRSLALGGNSRREHFPFAHDCDEYMDDRQGPESCNTNNMLKLAEGLFRMNPQAKYADYYERAMYNHILSTQHPKHGGYVYFTPARPSHYRVYSAPHEAMWCCVGTGMENHGKYGEFIYTHSADSLFVNLFVASELTWKEKDVVVEQKTDFPVEEGSTLTIRVEQPVHFKLLVRHPGWVATSGMEVVCDGVNYAENSVPSSYILIDRIWSDGDVVQIKTPMQVTVEEMPNVTTAIAIMRGPILMGAKTGTDNMPGLIANDDRWAHIAHGPIVSQFDAPHIIGDREEILAKLNRMQPIAEKPFSYTVPELFDREEYKDLVLEPFYGIHDSRYMMYWLSMTQSEFDRYTQEVKVKEQDKIILDQRTVDGVITGEQQPEVDHAMISKDSRRGHRRDRAWRDAHNGGYFGYTISTAQQKDLSLMITYWGNEEDEKELIIRVDGEVLVTENVVGKWNVNDFVNVEYKLPEQLLEGKNKITVVFETTKEKSTGEIFDIRLLRAKRQ